MAQPARFDIVIYIGDTFSLTVLFTDEAGTAIDISGYSFAAEVRAPGDGSLVATITADGWTRLDDGELATVFESIADEVRAR